MKELEKRVFSQDDLKLLLSELLEMGNKENATASALIDRIRAAIPEKN
ncbi:hypothetical protein [Alteribacter lacisalsi]|nr:hypothetical protein [Alteribacter lacisalsi]